MEKGQASLGWCDFVVGVSACTPESCGFDFWSGAQGLVPGLQVPSLVLVRGCMRETTN